MCYAWQSNFRIDVAVLEGMREVEMGKMLLSLIVTISFFSNFKGTVKPFAAYNVPFACVAAPYKISRVHYFKDKPAQFALDCCCANNPLFFFGVVFKKNRSTAKQ